MYHSRPLPLKSPNFQQFSVDITDASTPKLLQSYGPDVIIHAAALTDMSLCEKDPRMAEMINVTGTINMAKICNEIGGKFVYISTDYVFDGRKGNYSECDEPKPLSVYANTKLLGERATQEICEDHLIIRTSFHGWSYRKGHGSISERIVESLRAGSKVRLVIDHVSSLLYAMDLASIICEAARRDLKGLYHVGSCDSETIYEFGLDIAETFNLDPGLISLITLSSLGREYEAIRPKDVSLDVRKIESHLSKMPTVKEGIRRMRDTEHRFFSIAQKDA